MIEIEEPVEILLVEDNPNDLELALHAFKKFNLSNPLRIARDGEEALEILFGVDANGQQHARPKVVLLDLKLPKIDGIEVLQRIRSDPRTSTIPVVVLTSSQEERDIVETYRLGVNSYIVKPIDYSEFLTVVGQLGLYWVLLNEPPPVDGLMIKRA